MSKFVELVKTVERASWWYMVFFFACFILSLLFPDSRITSGFAAATTFCLVLYFVARVVMFMCEDDK